MLCVIKKPLQELQFSGNLTRSVLVVLSILGTGYERQWPRFNLGIEIGQISPAPDVVVRIVFFDQPDCLPTAPTEIALYILCFSQQNSKDDRVFVDAPKVCTHGG